MIALPLAADDRALGEPSARFRQYDGLTMRCDMTFGARVLYFQAAFRFDVFEVTHPIALT